ncbi:hypothetical protein HRR77_004946 [Exophiala dermatitidis]|nr:hypothetical protein HRR77_004946 [Exophiala dermatitidis]KAJ4623461.1 hypothetical protein HRR85_000331 [Exophiala dermatitidis]
MVVTDFTTMDNSCLTFTITALIAAQSSRQLHNPLLSVHSPSTGASKIPLQTLPRLRKHPFHVSLLYHNLCDIGHGPVPCQTCTAPSTHPSLRSPVSLDQLDPCVYSSWWESAGHLNLAFDIAVLWMPKKYKACFKTLPLSGPVI